VAALRSCPKTPKMALFQS